MKEQGLVNDGINIDEYEIIVVEREVISNGEKSVHDGINGFLEEVNKKEESLKDEDWEEYDLIDIEPDIKNNEDDVNGNEISLPVSGLDNEEVKTFDRLVSEEGKDDLSLNKSKSFGQTKEHPKGKNTELSIENALIILNTNKDDISLKSSTRRIHNKKSTDNEQENESNREHSNITVHSGISLPSQTYYEQSDLSFDVNLSTHSLSTTLTDDDENDLLNTLLLEYDIVRHYFNDNAVFTHIDFQQYLVIPEPCAMYDCKRRKDGKLNMYKHLFKTADEEDYNDTKPARLRLSDEHLTSKNCETGLLVYFASLASNTDENDIDLEFLESIISSGVDLNAHDQYGQTVLHACARDWSKDIVLFLLRNNADPDVKDKYGITPLHVAACLDCVDVATVLLNHGANPNSQTNYTNETPAHYAAKYNSLNVLKQLIKYGGQLESVNYLSRTPFISASAHGSADAVRFLLHEAEVPTAAIDSFGQSALCHLIERLPHLAYETLNQYIASRKWYQEYYLDSLQINPACRESGIKSVLELICFYKNRRLIMHPVIQKSIHIKWEILGAQKWLSIKLLAAVFYLALWLVLAYTFNDMNDFYSYFHSNKNYEMVWEIVFEALLVLMTFYFFVKERAHLRNKKQRHENWINFRKRSILSQNIFTHPAWPKEREFSKVEQKFLNSLSKQRHVVSKRFVYECVVLFFVLLTIATRAATIHYNKSTKLFLIHKTLFGITMMTSLIRIIIAGSHFHRVAIFFKMVPLVVKPVLQIVFLFLQFYIPFLALFWLMFGTEVLGGTKQTSSTGLYFESLYKFFRFLFIMIFRTHEFETNNKPLLYAFIALYHVFVLIIVCHILVADIITRVIVQYENFKADASILQAEYLCELERNLNMKNMKLVDHYYQTICNPLIVRDEKTPQSIKQNATRESLGKLQTKVEKLKELFSGMEDRFSMRNHESIYILPSILHNCRRYGKQQKDANRKLRHKIRTFMLRDDVISTSVDNLLMVDGIKAESSFEVHSGSKVHVS